jgi:SpoVK/Ycf46/Vps4 family AAA+-type ATPase
MSLVKMGDIRSKWVGESEKNLTLALNLLKSMAPVIVFIDEIDQAVGSRQTSSNDSGVQGRMFGKILEFMGDNENRGDVIWIAATNRTDLLDDAMIRRFDRIIPVLLPGSAKEWISVISGIANQMEAELNPDIIKRFVENHLTDLRNKHSGSSMEMVLRLAYQNAISSSVMDRTILEEHLENAFENFKSNFNQKKYILQTLLAIHACNDIHFITRPASAGDDISASGFNIDNYSYEEVTEAGGETVDRIVAETIAQKSNKPLEDYIKRLKYELQEHV